MGLRPKPRQEALPPGPPPKGEALWNLSIGFVLRGGPTRTLPGHGRPSPENKPINGFQGPLPLAEFQEAEPLGGASGRSPGWRGADEWFTPAHVRVHPGLAPAPPGSPPAVPAAPGRTD